MTFIVVTALTVATKILDMLGDTQVEAMRKANLMAWILTLVLVVMVATTMVIA